jgi:hypothetical protein
MVVGDDRQVTDLVAHLESFLGEIQAGSQGDGTTPQGVQVIWFSPGKPFSGVVTVTTLGLSRSHLEQPSGRGLHQELLMHLPTTGEPINAASVLFQVAQHLVDRGHGLLRGQVLGPWGQLFADTQMTALYAAAPVYLPDEFAVCDTPAATVVMTWLVPITDAEAHYVAHHGWRAFEDELLAEDPDLTDLARNSIEAALKLERGLPG